MGVPTLKNLMFIVFLICPLVDIIFLASHAFFITIFKGRILELNLGIGRMLFQRGYFSVSYAYFTGYSYRYEIVERKLIHKILIHSGGILFNLIFIFYIFIMNWLSFIHLNQTILSFVLVSGIKILFTLIPHSLNGFNSEGKQIYNLFRSGKTSYYTDLEKHLEQIDNVIIFYEQNHVCDDRLLNAYYNKAIELRKLECNEQALLYFEKVLEINPMKAEALGRKGNILIDLQKYNEALDCFQIAIKMEPDNSLLYYNAACTYSLLNEIEDTIKYLSKAIELDKVWKEKAKKDKDFDMIKDNTEFKRIIS